MTISLMFEYFTAYTDKQKGEVCAGSSIAAAVSSLVLIKSRNSIVVVWGVLMAVIISATVVSSLKVLIVSQNSIVVVWGVLMGSDYQCHCS